MAGIAESAVLVSSSGIAEITKEVIHITGPRGNFGDVESVLNAYPTLGFQASHYGQACAIGRQMLKRQHPSKVFVLREGDFVEVPPHPTTETDQADGTETSELVRPTLFLGITANLLGTGCREAVRFLVQEGIEKRVTAAVPSSSSPPPQPRSSASPPHATSGDALSCAVDSVPTAPASTAATGASFADETMHQRLKRCVRECTPSLYTSGATAGTATTDAASAPLADYASFLSAVVVSGGGMEHDLRRACEPYHVTHYASEKESAKESKTRAVHTTNASTTPAARFGNVEYGTTTITNAAEPTFTSSYYSGCASPDVARGGGASTSPPHPPSPPAAAAAASLFDIVMRALVTKLVHWQTRLREQATQRPPVADAYFDVCDWALTPSEIWALAGLWLEELFVASLVQYRFGDGAVVAGSTEGEEATSVKGARPSTLTLSDDLVRRVLSSLESVEASALRAEATRRAQSTVLYWAARQEVPVYSPSFVDGDIMQFILQHRTAAGVHPTCPPPLLQVDLVRDIHGINKLAMMSKKTGMIICGGGVVKHHVCNANLMRNGADLTILLNDGQEFDGSDGGARPEEAVSWGKVRIDGEAVKVYGEVTVTLPLIVGQVFVPAVRERNARNDDE